MTCQTAAQGEHLYFCDTCGNQRISYNSCRNRHCPKCQTITKERWLDNRKAELLEEESVETMMHRLTGIDINKCPKCGKGVWCRSMNSCRYFEYIVPNNKVTRKRKDFCNTC